MKRDENRSGLDRRRRSTGPGTDDVVEAQVLAAIRSLGWAIPQSEEEVAAAEQELKSKAVQLPDVIREAAAVDNQSPADRREPTLPIQFSASPGVEATLARAAREGAAITAEIEERMRRDRKSAEDKLAGTGDGERETSDGQDVR